MCRVLHTLCMFSFFYVRCMPDMPPLRTILEFTESIRLMTWLGSFGAATEKPLQIWSSENFVYNLKRDRPTGKTKRLATVYTKRQRTCEKCI